MERAVGAVSLFSEVDYRSNLASQQEAVILAGIVSFVSGQSQRLEPSVTLLSLPPSNWLPPTQTIQFRMSLGPAVYRGDVQGMGLRFIFDGGLAVSVSVLLAALTNDCVPWKDVQEQDGVVILAGILLFPTAVVMYGGAKMIFAAYEEYKKKRQEREDALFKQERERVEGRLGPVLADMSESERDRILRLVRGEPDAR